MKRHLARQADLPTRGDKHADIHNRRQGRPGPPIPGVSREQATIIRDVAALVRRTAPLESCDCGIEARYAGSIIIGHDVRKFDEFAIPLSAAMTTRGRFEPPKTQRRRNTDSHSVCRR